MLDIQVVALDVGRRSYSKPFGWKESFIGARGGAVDVAAFLRLSRASLVSCGASLRSRCRSTSVLRRVAAVVRET